MSSVYKTIFCLELLVYGEVIFC